MTKSSTRSKIHPYLILRNWMGTGQCVFWNDGMHRAELYEASIAEAIKAERGIVALQDNVGKNHSIR